MAWSAGINTTKGIKNEGSTHADAADRGETASVSRSKVAGLSFQPPRHNQIRPASLSTRSSSGSAMVNVICTLRPLRTRRGASGVAAAASGAPGMKASAAAVVVPGVGVRPGSFRSTARRGVLL